MLKLNHSRLQNICDIKLSIAEWIVIAKAVSSFASNVNSYEILKKLPEIFKSVGNYFLSENSNITESAAQCLIAIIIEGIKDKDLLLPPAVTEFDANISPECSEHQELKSYTWINTPCVV